MKSELYTSSGIPVIRGTNLTGGRKLTGDWVFISNETAKQLQGCIVNIGDLVFPHRGSIGEVGIITNDENNSIISSSLMKLSPDPAQVESLFLYYYFRSSEGKFKLLRNSSQVGTPGIGQPLASLKSIDLNLPPLPTQKAIAHLLGTLDDKIELLRQMNETLEAIAKALFQSWFVDFDPVRKKAEGIPTGLPKEIEDLFPSEFEESELGEIPKGWKVGKLGELTQIVGGSTPSTTNESFWNGEHHFATPKDLSNATSPILLKTDRRITFAGVKEISSGILESGTLLMSSRAPIGYVSLSEIPISINQGFIGFKKGAYLSNYFLFFWLKQNMETIIGNANGTTFLEISKSNFRMISCIKPSQEALSFFDNIVSTYFIQLKENTLQINNLIAIRDSLLPKLISGELELTDKTITQILEPAK
ncbi:restriction endonuclease subunit S [Leptospira kemamanensis]|uniref:Restriction endonuclease subunit S n=2 Tax=Leptospira kemamanensis TaxID=2484942 RepID=A0A4R9JPX8_9LEPT|nr:restriction endonuclease subunit S [Leptospira kemamanensis]